MSSKKKGGVQEGQLAKMLERGATTRLSSMSWSLAGGVKRKIGEGGRPEKHTIPVQGSCNEHAEAVNLLSSYSKGVRKSLKDRFVDVNDLSLFDVLHPSRVPKLDDPTFGDFGVQQVSGLLDIYGKDTEKGGQVYPALLSDSTLDQFRCTRPWCGSVAGEGGGSPMRTCMKIISWMTVFARSFLTWSS
jgi:hypothetical protein